MDYYFDNSGQKIQRGRVGVLHLLLHQIVVLIQEVVDISPATAGDDSRVVVARIDAPSGRMELPVEEDHGLKPGDEVIITPIVQTHPSGGSVTIFQVKPSPF